MRIGISYDLKAEQAVVAGAPDDLLEEYDSPETVDAIAGALRALGHEPLLLGGGRTCVERLLALSEGPGALDLVFNIAEGRGARSREAQLPALCELLGLRCTHSDALTLAVCQDKALTQRIAASHGIATPRGHLLGSVSDLDAPLTLALPVIVKLNGEGSSMGVRSDALCHSLEQVRVRAAQLLHDYGGPLLIEEFLPGTEVTVSVLGSGASARVAAMMEVAPAGEDAQPFMYSLDAKRNWRQRVRYHVPPRLPSGVLATLGDTALVAYRALGCRDLARLDLRLDAHGVPALIEINPLPGLHPETGDLPLSCARAGLPYEQLIAGIVADALQRPVPGVRA